MVFLLLLRYTYRHQYWRTMHLFHALSERVSNCALIEYICTCTPCSCFCKINFLKVSHNFINIFFRNVTFLNDCVGPEVEAACSQPETGMMSIYKYNCTLYIILYRFSISVGEFEVSC